MQVPRLTKARIAALVVFLVLGYLAFSAVGDVFTTQRLDAEETRLRREIAELRRQEGELQAIRDYLLTDAYLEGVARQTLDLVRPGETLVIIASSAEPTPTPEAAATPEHERRWWERLYDPQ